MSNREDGSARVPPANRCFGIGTGGGRRSQKVDVRERGEEGGGVEGEDHGQAAGHEGFHPAGEEGVYLSAEAGVKEDTEEEVMGEGKG